MKYSENKTYYKLTGTRRPANSPTGTPLKFKVIVSKFKSSESFTAKNAMDTARADMYSNGFEHILMTRVDIRIGNRWQNIPMLQALNLE